MDNKLNFEFIPVPKVMLEKMGITPAVIYAFIANSEKLKAGYCYMGYDEIGKKIGVSRNTIGNWITFLLEQGYLKDVSGRPSKRKGETKWLITVPERVKKLEDKGK